VDDLDDSHLRPAAARGLLVGGCILWLLALGSSTPARADTREVDGSEAARSGFAAATQQSTDRIVSVAADARTSAEEVGTATRSEAEGGSSRTPLTAVDVVSQAETRVRETASTVKDAFGDAVGSAHAAVEKLAGTTPWLLDNVEPPLVGKEAGPPRPRPTTTRATPSIHSRRDDESRLRSRRGTSEGAAATPIFSGRMTDGRPMAAAASVAAIPDSRTADRSGNPTPGALRLAPLRAGPLQGGERLGAALLLWTATTSLAFAGFVRALAAKLLLRSPNVSAVPG
jgi:hypothetical protein